MILPKLKKPESPNFSSGPTKKPDEWSVNDLNTNFLGRYHRSSDVKHFINNVLKKLKKILAIPNNYEVLLFPGSCSGAMEAVIWSFLGNKNVTAIIYDYWGLSWYEDLLKLNLKVELRKNLEGDLPDLNNIPKNNDIVFVWTGTSTGMTINNIDFIKSSHDGLVISDVTSAAFIEDLPWEKIDVSVFSWQKALGSESQHGIIVMSPKAMERLKKKNLPKVLSIFDHDFLVNTPSLLSISDFDLCLEIFKKKGGIKFSKQTCIKNKCILEEWIKGNEFVKFFCKKKIYRALTPCFFIFKKKLNHKQMFSFLGKKKIAFDIASYRKAKPGIRVWNGSNIKKNDLIALTNWLDWSFNYFRL
jgi:phosphoserine aminotransferase